MKPIRIFAFPSHATKTRTSGVDFLRIIQPIEQLIKAYPKEFTAEVYNPFTKEELLKPRFAIDIAKKFDIIYMNYIVNDWGYANIAAIAKKFGVKVVLDVDDSLNHILPDNPAYNVYKRGGDGIRIVNAIMRDVDHITVTNEYLKNCIIGTVGRKSQDITVLPNYIDLKRYTYRGKAKYTYLLYIYHFGSSTHQVSLQDQHFIEGMDKIMQEYPNVVFKTVGAFIPLFREKWGNRYENMFGHEDVYKWIRGPYRTMMEEADLFVTPLSVNIYNTAKSSTKFNEVSAARKPGVWQKIRQYEQVVKYGENGYVAESPQQWYKCIRKLLDSKDLREIIGNNAFTTVKRDWTIQGNIDKYKDFFHTIYLTKGK